MGFDGWKCFIFVMMAMELVSKGISIDAELAKGWCYREQGYDRAIVITRAAHCTNNLILILLDCCRA